MMKRLRNFRFLLPLVLVAVVADLCAQTASEKTLVVNGKNVGSAVRQIGGHSFVDVEALAQATNGAVTIEGNRVMLTIPVGNSGAAAQPASAPDQQRLSREFASAAIADLADMREWRGALSAMVTYGLAAGPAMGQEYHDRADADLRQASVAASTDADRNALQLLTNEFNTLTDWANQIAASRQSLNGAKTVDPNALQNDPTLSKISNCSRFLSGMVVSGRFGDDASCH
jgi:hypothetical protein